MPGGTADVEGGFDLASVDRQEAEKGEIQLKRIERVVLFGEPDDAGFGVSGFCQPRRFRSLRPGLHDQHDQIRIVLHIGEEGFPFPGELLEHRLDLRAPQPVLHQLPDAVVFCRVRAVDHNTKHGSFLLPNALAVMVSLLIFGREVNKNDVNRVWHDVNLLFWNECSCKTPPQAGAGGDYFASDYRRRFGD